MKFPFYAVIDKSVIRVNKRKLKARSHGSATYVANIVGSTLKFILRQEDLEGNIPENQSLMELLYGKSRSK